MSNFIIRYSYDSNSVVRYESAVVRASSVSAAHDKLVRFLTRSGQLTLKDFSIIKTSLSSFNLILS